MKKTRKIAKVVKRAGKPSAKKPRLKSANLRHREDFERLLDDAVGKARNGG